jgi:hypothetical protein
MRAVIRGNNTGSHAVDNRDIAITVQLSAIALASFVAALGILRLLTDACLDDASSLGHRYGATAPAPRDRSGARAAPILIDGGAHRTIEEMTASNQVCIAATVLSCPLIPCRKAMYAMSL